MYGLSLSGPGLPRYPSKPIRQVQRRWIPLVLGLEWGSVCAARRLTKQRECLTGDLNIYQAIRSLCTGLHLLHIAYTTHLSDDPGYNQTNRTTLLTPTHSLPLGTVHWLLGLH